MSYILEALRRAERERQMSKIPTVESLAQAPLGNGNRVPLRVWLLGGTTIAIAAAALIVSLWPHPAPAPAPVAVAEPAPAPVAPPPVVRTPSRVAPTGIEDDGELQSLDDVATSDGGAAAADTAQAAAQPRPQLQAPPQWQMPPDNGGDGERTITPTQSTPPTAAAPPAGNTIAVPSGVTVLREMPESYRAQFPVRTLDVHVYDPDPARRWIMVSGKRYGEGSTLDSGPRVAQITEAGVVFEFQNALVLLPVR